MQYPSVQRILARGAGVLTSILALWSGSLLASPASCTNGQCCTHTQEGWDGVTSTLLASNFATVYPGGFVEVGIPGAAGFSLKFTSAAALGLYLPASGAPQALNADAINPATTSAGSLGGEVLALQLNVDYNELGAIPGATNCHFGDRKLVDPSSPLSGKTVRQILALANAALGGADISSNGVSLVQLNQLLVLLNGAYADCVAPADAQPPVTLQQLITSNGFLISGGKKFSNFRFLGDTNVINPANIFVEMPALFEGCLGLRFRGGMIAYGDVADIGLFYSVETTNGLPLLNEIGQRFTYAGTGNGGYILIGETVFATDFFIGFVAQSSVGFNDVMDAPGEPVQGDSLLIAPPRAKVWVTKDIILTPADAQSTVELKHIDQVFCGPPVNCCMESPWAMTHLSQCVDLIPPTLICGANKMVDCGQPWSFDAPTAFDNCGSVTVVVLGTTTNVTGGFGCAIQVARTWSATDQCGNSNLCAQIVSILDTLPPVVTCAPARMVECGTAWTFDAASASDQCAGTNVILRIVSTVTNTAGFCGNTFSATRTWEATDPCTNSARCSQTITVKDTTPPGLVCPPDLQFAAGVAWNFGVPTAMDTCGSTTITVDGTTTNVLCGDSYIAQRNWRATDACGNMSFCTQTITVTGLPPTVVCAKDKKVDCDDSWDFHPPTVIGGGNQVGIIVLSTVTNQICGPSYSATRIWEVTDGCDNRTNCTQTVTVVADLDIDCGDDKTVECGASWAFDPPRTRHCQGADVDVDIVYTVTNELGNGRRQVIRKWRIKDSCGNEDSCKQIITIVDNVPGAAHCASDKSVECGSAWNFDPPSADGKMWVVGTWTNGACGGTYTATRTWTVEDRCGNPSQCSQTVTLVDTIAPILCNLPTNLVVECHVVPEPARVTAADPVSTRTGDQILLNSNNIVGGSGSWANTTWNAPGSPFNAFHITDNQTGSISERSPGNFWLGREGQPAEYIVIDLGKPILIDRIDLFNTHHALLDNRRTKDFEIRAGRSVIDTGVTGLDLDGTIDLILSNRLTFHLAKNDPIEPDTFTVTNGLAPCAAYRYLRFETLNGYGPEGVGLNEIRVYGRMVCDPEVEVTFEEFRQEGHCPTNYTLTRVWTAIDDCGNTRHGQQLITVIDTTAPEITCPHNQILQGGAPVPPRPETLAEFLDIGGHATDLCDPNLFYACTDGPVMVVGGVRWMERRHRVMDACGNSNSCVQVFFISDSVPPLALPLPMSRLSIYVDAEAGWVILQWDAVAGARYCVQYKDDLPTSGWTPLSGDVCPAGDIGVKEDSFDPGRKRFYRVVRMP